MIDFFKMGWNDRCEGRNFRAFRSTGGELLMNLAPVDAASVWSQEERAEYVRGWDKAEATILAMVLP